MQEVNPLEKFDTAAFEDVLPQALKNDTTIYRYAQVLSTAIREVNAEMSSVVIWANIDDLSEDLLNILAADLHIDWWNQATSLDAKRELIKSARKTHMKMGTPSAIESAVESLTGCSTEVTEWFDYQGDPGWFRITITFDDINPEYFSSDQVSAWEAVLPVIERTKRFSQWLEGITVVMPDMDSDAIPANTTPVCTWLSTCLPEWDKDEAVLGNFFLDVSTLAGDDEDEEEEDETNEDGTE